MGHDLALMFPPPIQGIRNDLPRFGVDSQYCWDASNVIHRGTSLIKVPGYTKIGATLSGRVQRIVTFVSLAQVATALCYTGTNAYEYVGGTWTQRNPGGAANFYTTGSKVWITAQVPRQDVLLATNSRDQVQKWIGPGNNHASVGGAPPFTKADGVAVFRDFVVYWGLTEGGTYFGTRVRWTDQSAYETYVGTLGGFQDLPNSDRVLFIKAITNDTALIYRQRSIWLMRYIGAPLVWSFEQLVEQYGLISPMYLDQHRDHHILVGTDDYYEYDGNSLVPFSDVGRLLLFNLLDTAKNDAMQLLSDTSAHHRFWFFADPSASSDYANNCVVSDYETIHGKERAWWKRNDISPTGVGLFLAGSSVAWSGLTGTWLDQVGPWVTADTARAALAWGDVNGNVYQFSPQTNDGNGVAIVTSYESGLYNAAEMLLAKYGKVAGSAGFVEGAGALLIELRVFFGSRGSQNFFVDVAGVPGPNVTPSWVTYTVPPGATSFAFFGTSVRGRFFAYRVRTTGTGSYPDPGYLEMTFVADSEF